ncbi:MAG: ABC transporter permease subunit [Micrococcales bacterium]|nr:ABC transporter permease subunit [Micrococcales bacterium]
MNVTISALAVQALVGQRRVWTLLALPACLIALAVGLRVFAPGASSGQVLSSLGYPVLLPLVALLATSSVLGPEIDDGSIVYLLAKPVNRYVVAMSKYVVAWAATILVGALPLWGVAMLIDGGATRRALAWGVAAAVAGTTYCALFLALSALTRHAVVVGLLFVLMWEGLLGGLLAGIAWVSVRQWGLRAATALHEGITGPELSLAYALGAALVVTIGGIWLTGDRLRSFTVRGDE